jgi:hypothetical protein
MTKSPPEIFSGSGGQSVLSLTPRRQQLLSGYFETKLSRPDRICATPIGLMLALISTTLADYKRSEATAVSEAFEKAARC